MVHYVKYVSEIQEIGIIFFIWVAYDGNKAGGLL